MTDDTTNAPSPPPPRRRWRDDPLSVFLAIAAVLLGLMYFLEQRDVDRLRDASARAQALSAQLNLPDCTVGSASTDGTTLVISCPSTAADAARAASTKTASLDGFREVVFAGSDVQLACPPAPASWPDGCTQNQNPTPK